MSQNGFVNGDFLKFFFGTLKRFDG